MLIELSPCYNSSKLKEGVTHGGENVFISEPHILQVRLKTSLRAQVSPTIKVFVDLVAANAGVTAELRH